MIIVALIIVEITLIALRLILSSFATRLLTTRLINRALLHERSKKKTHLWKDQSLKLLSDALHKVYLISSFLFLFSKNLFFLIFYFFVNLKCSKNEPKRDTLVLHTDFDMIVLRDT